MGHACKKYARIGAALLALLGTAVSLSSCTLWEWLWSRDVGDPIDTADHRIGGCAFVIQPAG